MRAVFTIWILGVVACGHSNQDVPCTDNSNCDLTTGGVCTPADTGNSWCAYPDPACSSGTRFSSSDVGDGLAGECVPGTSAATFTLTVGLGGSGTGGVTSDPGGVTCASQVCTGTFDAGTIVHLTATATQGQFLGWSDACTGTRTCDLVMDHDQSAGALFGTPGESLWATQIGGSGTEYGNSTAVDGNGDILVVGRFSSSITLGTTTLTSAGKDDLYVAKLSGANGSVVWAKSFGGTMDDNASKVAVDGSNDIYIAGYFTGAIDFGGGALQAGTARNGFALKLTKDGAFVWARQLKSPNNSNAISVAVRGNTVAVGGLFLDSVMVDATTLNSSGSADIFVMSVVPATGTTNWIKSFGGSDADVVTDIAIDGSNNLVVVGYFAGTVNFGGGALTTPGGFDDALILKLTAATGAHLLSLNFGGTDHDYAESVAIDGADNIVISGEFHNTAHFGCAADLVASQPPTADIYIAKYSSAGACVWSKGFGGTGNLGNAGRAVAANANGDVAFAGAFDGTISFGGSMLTAAGTGGTYDVFAARFAADGTHLNSIRAGGTGSEFARAVAEAPDGRFFVAGDFSGFSEFGGTVLTPVGQDAFVAAFNAL